MKTTIFMSDRIQTVRNHINALPKKKVEKKDRDKHIQARGKNEKRHKKSEGIKELLYEKPGQELQENQETCKKTMDCKDKNNAKNDRFKLVNDIVRKKNSLNRNASELKHPKPWGLDQRPNKEPSHSKFSSIYEGKIIKDDKEIPRRERKKHLPLYTGLRSKSKSKQSHNSKSEEKTKSKQSPDPQLIQYIKPRKKSRVPDFQKRFENMLKQHDEFRGLLKYEKQHQKRLNKKKKKKKSKSPPKTIEYKVVENIIFSSERKEKYQTFATDDTNKDNSEDHRQEITEKLRKLKERVAYTQSLLKTQAAVTIQRWFRANKHRFQLKISEHLEDSLESSLKNEPNSGSWIKIDKLPHLPVEKSDLVQNFENKLKQSHEALEKIIKSLDNYETNDLENSPSKIITNKNSNQKVSLNKSFEILSSESLSSEKNTQETQSRPKIIHKVPVLALGNIFSIPSIEMDSSSKQFQNSQPSDYKSLSRSYENCKGVEITENSDYYIKSYNSYNSKSSNSELVTGKSIENKLSSSSGSGVRNKNFNIKFPNNQKRPSPSPNELRLLTKSESPKDSLDNFANQECFFSEESFESLTSENLLKSIFSKNSAGISVESECPGLIQVENSESSDEEWNRDLPLYMNTFLPSQPQDEKAKIIDGPHYQSISNFDIQIIQIIENEIESFLELVKFNTAEKPINPHKDFIDCYLKKCEEIIVPDEVEILDIVNTPAYIDPLSKLEMLQSSEIFCSLKSQDFEIILPQGINDYFEEPNKIIVFDENLNSKTDLNRHYERIYLQFLYDCTNESLNYIRPFGIKGLPHPWSYKFSIPFGEGQLKIVFDKARKFISRWESVHSGSYPDENCKNDEEKLQKIRENRLGVMLSHSVEDDEPEWVMYEDEETQVKIDVADLVFDAIVDEVEEIIREN